MRPSCSNVIGSEARRAKHCGINNMAVKYRLVTNLSLRDVCVADGIAILSTACYISTYMHSHVSCSRSMRRVNKSRLSERIEFFNVTPISFFFFFFVKSEIVANLTQVNIL